MLFLASNLIVFWPYPEHLSEAKLKGNVLILVEKISREHNIQDVAWLLLISFSLICTKKELKVEQKILKIMTFIEESNMNLLKVIDKADAHKILVIV